MELPPELEFSESEFEQAGLLADLDSCSAAPPSGSNVATNVQPQQQCHRTMQSPSASAFGLTRRLQNPSEPWRSQPSSAPLQSTVTQHNSLCEGVALPTLRPENIAQRWTNFQECTAAQQEQITDAPRQHRSLPLDVTADIRKQANRDHQKRFRERQKVLSHFHNAPTCILDEHTMLPTLTLQARSEAMQAQLDTTLTQMQELKLQKLELEQQLQRSVQARFVPIMTNEV